MAAGKGTRMKDPEMAKVMFTIDGKPMVEHVVDLAGRLRSERTIVVVGWKKESVVSHLTQTRKAVVGVEQSPHLGTGHAVMQAETPLEGFDGNVLVLSGDVPLLTHATVSDLLHLHDTEQASVSVLTAILDDPSGYGRIVRDGHGNVASIVEHNDATARQRAIREINSGIYVFDKQSLFDGLKEITPNNAQKEYYLTDVLGYFWRNNLKVAAMAAKEHREIQGINTMDQLEEARSLLATRSKAS
jgi:UDP-N-acetylglucosamine pyrophosphorylase